MDGGAWLLIGFCLCFLPDIQMRLVRSKFNLVLGGFLTIAGLTCTLIAMLDLLSNGSHGLLRFYELAGIGPLLISSGFLFLFNSSTTCKSIQ